MNFFRQTLALPLIGFFALVLAGCSPGDIQLEGKVFDAIGVNNLTGGKKADPKLAARAPLVMPPATGTLPQPGSEVAPDNALAGIRDPEQTKKLDEERLAKAQKEYCDKHFDPQQAAIENIEVIGPAGNCRQSILDNVSINGIGF